MNIKNYCKHFYDDEVLFRNLNNQPDRLTEFIDLILQDDEWRVSHRGLVVRFTKKLKLRVSSFTSEDSTLSKIQSKLLEDHLKTITSLNAYTAYIKENRSHIQAIDLRKFGNQIENLHIQELIASCPHLTQLFISSDKIDNEAFKELNLSTSLKKLFSAPSQAFKEMASMPALKIFYPIDTKAIDKLGVKSLERLELGNSSLKELDISNMENLKILRLQRCQRLTEIKGLHLAISLKHLNITDCYSLKELDVSAMNKCRIVFSIDLVAEELRRTPSPPLHSFSLQS